MHLKVKNTGIVRTSQRDTFALPLLPCKGWNVKYSECVSVALVTRHAKRMSRIIYQLWPTWPYHIFPHYLINGTIFGGKKLRNIKCKFWFSYNFCLKHFIQWKKWDIITNVHRTSCKAPVILVRFYWNLNFLNRFSKNLQIRNFTKIRPGLAERAMRTDRQTDRDMKKLIIASRNFANAPTKNLSRRAFTYPRPTNPKSCCCFSVLLPLSHPTEFRSWKWVW